MVLLNLIKKKKKQPPFSQVLWSVCYSFPQTLLKIYETFMEETHPPPKLLVALVVYQQSEGNKAEGN